MKKILSKPGLLNFLKDLPKPVQEHFAHLPRLIEGFPLDSALRALPHFQHNAITEVSHEAFTHKLLVCLDAAIAEQTLRDLAAAPSASVLVCLDSALSDEAKLRLQDCVTLKVI